MNELEKLKVKIGTCDDKTVYNKCNRYILILEKLEDTLTNESRSDVVDKYHAQFKANKLLVKKIIDVVTLEEKDRCDSHSLGSHLSSMGISNKIIYKTGKEYIAGQILENSNTDFSLPYPIGETYYLTLEKAYFNVINTKLRRNGKNYSWYDNGQKREEYTIIDKKINGKYEEWYENGKKRRECNYVNDKLDGKYEEWHENGKKKIKCVYVDGNVVGKYERWFPDGTKDQYLSHN
uniref:Uncharacterized protein n=1 Tax=viral metagenome TaxID=1070528 RepID=A0A6C0EAX7_9ZZZZ